MSSLTLENLGVTTCKEQLIASKESSSILGHFDRFMSQKKMHEVLMMSETVSEMCQKENVTSLVDVGSGKAYLSQVLAAMQKHLAVLAVDSQSGNLKGAQKRSANLEKQWEALIRRALCRASGQEPPKRGKHWKSKNAAENVNTDETEDKLSLDNLKYDTLFVDTKTDLRGIFAGHFPCEDHEKFGLIGLHTCGNLAANSLQIFLANGGIKFCCNVGCCYHLIDEEFYANPHVEEDDTIKKPCFPMSTLLKDKGFFLGRNARMVAAQPMDRTIYNRQMPSQSLLWRAILQHILLLHNPELRFEDQQVGRIASKSANFIDYVQKGFVKLDLDLKMTPEELETVYQTLSRQFGHKLNAFYLLRSLFAPLIEGLILLDRLTFLLEQDSIQEAHLVRLFDAVISPRCYAIIANKV